MSSRYVGILMTVKQTLLTQVGSALIYLPESLSKTTEPV